MVKGENYIIMKTRLIDNKLNNVNRRKFYLALTLVFLSLFSVIFISQISSPYVINSFAASTSSSLSSPVYLAYFYEVGCHDCDKVKIILNDISAEYPDNLIMESFDINLTDSMELAESLGELYQMPEEERLLVPVIFIGDNYLFRDAITFESLKELIQKYSTTETIAPWEKIKEKDLTAQDRLIARFQSFGLTAVAVSGLIDGINPCAFATIIFFISYLALINRKGREILWVGGMFALSVFLTYFLIGTGALKMITSLSFLPLVRKIFVLVTAALAVILGVVSLYDYLQFKKKGTTKDAKLQLPPFLKNMIHSAIRKNVRLSNYIIMAAVTGFIVSLLELACTGQIYLPTIMFISTIPDLKVNALFYLLFYNLMFILPLVLVFSFTYWGTTSAQWAELTQKNFGKIKMAMTLLFFGLAVLLFYSGIFYS
jgi:thiol-disulfide isomerase/thioredoxin